MRLLFARVGRTICRQCGKDVIRETAEIVARRLERAAGGHAAPDRLRDAAGGDGHGDRRPAGGRRTTFDDADAAGNRRPAGSRDPLARTLDTLRRRGFGRLLMDGRAVAFEEVDPAALQGPHRGRGGGGPREGRGRAAEPPDRFGRDVVPRGRRRRVRARAARRTAPPSGLVFSERFECRTCGIAYETPQPRLFSFNNPFGACPTCNGFGNVIELDMQLVVPDAVEDADRRRHRAVEQAALPLAPGRAEAGGQEGEPAAGRAVAGPDRRGAADGRGGLRRLRRRPRLLPLARAQEVQGARPRVPEPLPRLPGLPGLRRRPPAARSARRAGRRPHHRRGVGADRPPGAGVLPAARAHREGSGGGRTRCCARSSGGWAS